jgi:hypothetical protein
VQVDDLVQNGMLGLLDAMGRFEAGLGPSSRPMPRSGCAARCSTACARTTGCRAACAATAAASKRRSPTRAGEGRAPTEKELADSLGMALADYQKMLQEARGHQLVYIEDLVSRARRGLPRTSSGRRERRSGDTASRTRIFVSSWCRRSNSCPSASRLMMALYYEQDLNLREIGEVMGVTESRVCQLHSQAVLRLRARLFGDGKQAPRRKSNAMDRISVIGLLIGVLAIVGGQILEGGHLGALAQPTALLIVVGGTLGAVMLQSPYATFVRGMRMVKWIWYPPVVDHLQLIQQVTGWSQVSRREGLLALDAVVNELKDEFTRKGLQLLVDGAEPERLREVMEVEISDLRAGDEAFRGGHLGGGRRLLADDRHSRRRAGADPRHGEPLRSRPSSVPASRSRSSPRSMASAWPTWSICRSPTSSRRTSIASSCSAR